MTTAVEKVWSQQEIKREAELRDVVDRGQTTFVDVGLAVAEIRDSKLYLLQYDTFEEYCEKNWGWTRQRLYQIMDAGQIHEALPQNVKQCLTSEKSVRALKPVPPKQRPAVVREAVKESPNGHVSARAITEAAQRVVAPTKPAPQKQLLDATGWPVPDELVKLFHRVDEVKEVLGRIAATRGLMRRVEETRDILWQPVNKSTMNSDLDRIYHELKMALPYAVCPKCQGRDINNKSCDACKGRGVISEFIYKTAIPEELKAVREKSCKK